MASSKQQRPQGNGGGADMLTWAALVAGVAIMFLMIWDSHHALISSAYGYWRRITNILGWMFGEWIYNVPVIVKPFHDAAEYFRVVDPAEVEFSTIRDTSKPVNIGILLLVILPLAFRSVRSSMKNNPLNHKNFGKVKDFTVESFMGAQEKVYPHLKLFGALKMLKQGVNEGRLRMADNAKQFVIRNNLISSESTIDTIVIDRQKAHSVFVAQLGGFWNGLEALSPQELVLFAAFAPKAAGTDIEMTDSNYEKALETSTKVLNSMWRVFAPEKDGSVPSGKELLKKLADSPEYAEAKKVAHEYATRRVVHDLIEGHAYVRTVLYDLLVTARRTGVLPSADFRWCKLVDRRLWLALNNVGRTVAFPEVSGIYAHYLYEVKARKGVEKPMVETAVEALQGAFEKLMFTEYEWSNLVKVVKENEA